MKIKKLTKREFARAIETGRGSAFLHVRHYGDKGVEQELLNACLTDLRYDSQFESGRSTWLASIIDCTNQSEFYADRIANALKEPGKTEANFGQLVYLSADLFDRGFFQFKRILMDLKNLENQEKLFDLPPCLIDVAGMTGFEVGARLLVRNKAEAWDCTVHFKHLIGCAGEKEATKLVTKRGKENQSFSEFWAEFGSLFTGDPWNEVTEPKANPLTVEKAIEAIYEGVLPNKYSRRLRTLGRWASDDEIETVVFALERETEAAKKIQLLKFFTDRAFPRIPKGLLKQIFTRDPELRKGLRSAFSNVQSPAVRKVALSGLRRNSQEDLLTALSLLENNSDSSDGKAWLDALKKLRVDHIRHSAVCAAINWYERKSDEQASEVMRLAYALTPCSFCRGSVMRLLIENDQAPLDLIFESQWDANVDLRLLARGVATPP